MSEVDPTDDQRGAGGVAVPVDAPAADAASLVPAWFIFPSPAPASPDRDTVGPLRPKSMDAVEQRRQEPRDKPAQVVTFDRRELREILDLYGRKVADGEWRDYAIDFTPQKAVFSIFRRTSEFPLYRIEKVPKLARKQGAFSVIAATGLILKRGHELARVIAVLDKKLKLVAG